MKKLICTVVIIVVTALLLYSCKKVSEKQTAIIGDSLEGDDLAFLDSIGIPTPALTDMYGYDGNLLGRPAQPQTLTATLVDQLLSDAQSLSLQKSILHPSEGTNKPEHKGFVYSYGQRGMDTRLNPPDGNSLHRRDAVFGTDCSGLMINLLRHAGVEIANTIVADFEGSLRSALANNTLYSSLTVQNLGCIPENATKSGDFILWFLPNGNHIGLVDEVYHSPKAIFNSNGTGTPGDEADQAKNLGPNRGVHAINLSSAVHGNGYWGTNYTILRLHDPLSTAYPPVTDIDGNTYYTVVIGTQIWMTQNLKLKHYRNGDPIPNVSNNQQWSNVNTGAYSNYNNDPAYSVEHGHLYNLTAITDTRNIAPRGWHVPTSSDWETLFNNTGGIAYTGGSLKESGTVHWQTPNTGATNSSGFTAIPGGIRNNDGSFDHIGGNGYWWSATESSPNKYSYEHLCFSFEFVNGGELPKQFGLSVRCVKD